MKKLSFVAFAAVLALTLCSCRSVFTSDGASMVPQVKACHPGYAAVLEHKTVRVSGTAQVNVLFGLFAWGADGFADNSKLSFFSFLPSAENFAKSAAVYDACQKNKVDTLVGTRYTVDSMDYFVFKTVKCDVAGFPAKMTGIKKKSAYVVNNKLYWLSEKPVVVK